ncbi:hypothetical protein [Streptomonospora litoralis]|uniref:Uncharacterized protein n=1 Tax=Streptomonospora litoralis TaxID=2498135 RepID=A0A4V0ZKF4_9ACTN|nr:hypothetical protein [Streptomonospora litoralis]QBI56792.1 hypothetical protein EKD16_25255 [Streptomonospora litoralis]
MPYPQWFAGMTLTADRLNASRMKMVVASENQEVAESTNLVASEIVIPLESGATYWYHLVLTYSARNTNNDTEGGGIRWNWLVPTGTTAPRQIACLDVQTNSGISLTYGGTVTMRSPATSTEIRAEGSGVNDFLSAHEYGSIQVGGSSGSAVLQWAQWAAHAEATVLRGATRTRCFYTRVQ